jgi:hypothetical protein
LAVSSVKENRTKIENAQTILYHLTNIWKSKDFEIRRFGKFLGYGLKQFEFSKYDKHNYHTNERKFREYKNELLEARLIHEIHTKNKKSGRPFYQITPIGVAYLVQNLKVGSKDLKNCFDVITYFYKNEMDIKLKEDYEYYFKKSCQLISGNQVSTTFQSIIGDDFKADLTIDVGHYFHGYNDTHGYRKTSHHIIGNMCWLLLQYDTVQKNASEWAKSVDNNKFISIRVSKEILKIGKKYGESILKNILQSEIKRIERIILQS